MHWTGFETWSCEAGSKSGCSPRSPSWGQESAKPTELKTCVNGNTVQHWTKTEINNSTSWLQVHQGGQHRLPPSCIASLACDCMMAACPLHIQSYSYHTLCKKGLHTHTRRSEQCHEIHMYKSRFQISNQPQITSYTWHDNDRSENTRRFSAWPLAIHLRWLQTGGNKRKQALNNTRSQTEVCRYVDWASSIHTTVRQMRLRWMETSEAHSIPLLSEFNVSVHA